MTPALRRVCVVALASVAIATLGISTTPAAAATTPMSAETARAGSVSMLHRDAQELIRLAGSPVDPRLGALAVAHRGMAMAAQRKGVATRTTAEWVPRLPSEAVEALAAQAGVTLDPADDDVAALDALEPRMARELARWVDAFAAVDAAGVGANAMGARLAFVDATARLVDAFDAPMNGAPPQVSVPPVIAFDLSQSSNTYDDDVVLSLDAGGDDTYRNNAGGAVLIDSAAVDLGGNDQYLGERGTGVNGGAELATGFLYDAGGNDFYRGTSAANGGGWFGYGALIDAAGDDAYEGAAHGTNGGGAFGGVGTLVDFSGDDRYAVGTLSSNGGGNGGSGLLFDGRGNDVYTAGSDGVNGGAVLGSGLLVDSAGNDQYRAGGGGANGGGDLGVGLLYDGGGTDVYDDTSGGSGTDRTVAPKGSAGAQVDVANKAPAIPLLVSPEPDATVFHGQPEEYLAQTSDPEGEPYVLTVTVRSAITNQVVQAFESSPALSGTQASAFPPGSLAPGQYEWSAHARDLRGQVGPESGRRTLTVTE